MGRFRNAPITNRNDRNSVERREHVDESLVRPEVLARLGLDNLVCSDCDANNAAGADRCRRCDSGSLRAKASDFRND